MTTALPRSSRPLLQAVAGLIVAAACSCTPTVNGPLSTVNPDPNHRDPLPEQRVCLRPDCSPDPGWEVQDCNAAEAGLEFFRPSVVDFEYPDPTNGFVGRFMYGYTDGTANTNAARGYQPNATTADRCLGQPGNHVFHLTGGPFVGWGGGIGVAMEHFTQDLGLCSQSNDPNAPPYCIPLSAGNTLSFAAMDFSEWEGVAVWARRAPDSQPLLRVLVGNKDTDDDISFLMYGDDLDIPHHPERIGQLYCQRVKECGCQFQDAPCTWSDGDLATSSPAGYYCKAPGATPSYANMAPAMGSTGYTNRCNTTQCDTGYSAFAGSPSVAMPYGAPDPQFAGRPCTAYATRSGVLSSYCYDPATDPPPASGDQQCGDHFTFPLHLTTEWQLYLVPFTTMYQQGWAKRAAYFDLHTISVVRLTWDAGLVDYWIDDLRFYRHTQKP